MKEKVQKRPLSGEERRFASVLQFGGLAGIVLLFVGSLLNAVFPVAGSGEARWMNPSIFLGAGIWLLMFTPVATIILMFLFASRNKDWRFLLMCGLLLFILTFSFLLSYQHFG